MAEPFIFINSYGIKPGKEEQYQQDFRQVAELVEAEDQAMLYFGHHMSEDGTVATTVQVHSHADNMAAHMNRVGDHIQKAMQYLDASSMSIQIFGSPTEALLEQMRQLAGSGVSVTVSPAAVSFHRFSQLESIEN